MIPYRSSRPEVFCKKDVLRKFAKFTGKHLHLRPATLSKKETLAQVFSCEFSEISKRTFFYKTPLVAASILTYVFTKVPLGLTLISKCFLGELVLYGKVSSKLWEAFWSSKKHPSWGISSPKLGEG